MASRLELQLELKKLKLAITRAEAAKEEIDMKTMEAQVNVERMKKHQKLQDEVIVQKREEILELEEKIKNYKDE